jgi:hypothetical protein
MSSNLDAVAMGPADKMLDAGCWMPPCRSARYTAADFEKSVSSGCRRGQAIGRELELFCVLLSLALLTCAFPVSRLRSAPAALGWVYGLNERPFRASFAWPPYHHHASHLSLSQWRRWLLLRLRSLTCPYEQPPMAIELAVPPQHPASAAEPGSMACGVVMCCWSACITISQCYRGPQCPTNTDTRRLLSGQRRLFHLPPTLPNSCSVNPYQRVGGLVRACQAQHRHKRLSSSFFSR